MKQNVIATIRRIGMIVILSLFAISVYAQNQVHVVERGETLTTIAEKYQVSVAAIKEANPNLGAFIFVGMELVIPEKKAETNPVTVAPIQSSPVVTKNTMTDVTGIQINDTDTKWNKDNHPSAFAEGDSDEWFGNLGFFYAHPIMKGDFDSKWGFGLGMKVRLTEIAPKVGLYSGYEWVLCDYNYKGPGNTISFRNSVPFVIGIGKMGDLCLSGGGFVGIDYSSTEYYDYLSKMDKFDDAFLFIRGLQFSVSVGPLEIGYRMYWEKNAKKSMNVLTFGFVRFF